MQTNLSPRQTAPASEAQRAASRRSLIHENVWSVYLLELSGVHNYVGITSDIENRLNSHKSGYVKTTLNLINKPDDVKLIKCVFVGSYALASKIERLIHIEKDYNLINKELWELEFLCSKLRDTELELKCKYSLD